MITTVLLMTKLLVSELQCTTWRGTKRTMRSGTCGYWGNRHSTASILTATCSLAGWEPNIKELIRRPRLDSTPADACRAWQLIVFCNPDSNRSSFVVVAKINPCGYRGQQNEKSKHVSSHMVVLYCNIREYKLLGLELHLRLPIAWHNNTHY